jgi:uncharacterized repeat protein (TIGR01451 family)
MATFTNQATLTYNGVSTNSNVAFGEILDALTATKTAVEDTYAVGDTLTYVVALRNVAGGALAGLTVTDDLGGYDFGGTTVYPLTLVAGSVLFYVDGVLQPAPAVTAGPPLVISGLTLPADSDAVIVYQARVNEFAPPAADGTVVNTVTVTGDGLSAPVTATETVAADTAAALTISKSISPTQVVDNDRVTYTFVIQNFGNEAVANGLFATNPGQITVPAATFVQDPVTGAYSVTPGTATLVVVGTI